MDVDLALEYADESLEGGYNDHALHALAAEVRLLRAQLKGANLSGKRVGTVRFLRRGGNPGIAWYVRPDLDNNIPSEGDIVYAVTPNKY